MRDASAQQSNVMHTQSIDTHRFNSGLRMSTGWGKWRPGEQYARLSSRSPPRVAWPGQLSVPGGYLSPQEWGKSDITINRSKYISITQLELDHSDKLKYLIKEYIQKIYISLSPLKTTVQKWSNIYDTHELQPIRYKTETYLWQSENTDIIQIEMTKNRWDFGFIKAIQSDNNYWL